MFSHQFADITAPAQPIVYEGRALEMDEFNAVAKRFLDTRNPHLAYDISVRLVSDEEVIPAPVKVEETPVEEPAAETAETPPEASRFILDGKSIFFEGQHVAGLYGDGEAQHLRVKQPHADLRPEIEAWLSTLNTTEQ